MNLFPDLPSEEPKRGIDDDNIITDTATTGRATYFIRRAAEFDNLCSIETSDLREWQTIKRDAKAFLQIVRDYRASRYAEIAQKFVDASLIFPQEVNR